MSAHPGFKSIGTILPPLFDDFINRARPWSVHYSDAVRLDGVTVPSGAAFFESEALARVFYDAWLDAQFEVLEEEEPF